MAAPQALVATRTSWHRVAEHVLAAGQFVAAGTIRLRPRPGGFATTAGVGDRQLAVVGDELHVVHAGSTRSQRLTTLGDAARFADVELGLRGSYSPATGADPDAPLEVDPAAARTLADWFALGDVALRRLADDLGAPQDPVLWPEHFDVGVTVDGVNYGCSPGDAALPDPYLYVGPHEGPPARDDFWNAPFGAALTVDRVRSVDGALAFFQTGRDRLEGSRT